MMNTMRIWLLAVMATLACAATATDFTWNGAASSDWANNGNWTPNNGTASDPNGTAVIARYLGPGANQPNLANNRTVNQLHFGAGGTVSLTGGSTLTLDGTSPTIFVTSGSHSIACPVDLGANLAIQVDAGSQLTISGAISGAFAITKTGTGTLVLSGANSHTGLTTVSAGTLRIEHATALGTTAAGTTVSAGAMLTLANGITVADEAIAMNGTLRIDSATSCTLSGAVGLTFGGTPSIEVLQGTHSFAASIDVTVNADTTAFVSSGGALTISDTALSGNGLITKVGTGTLTFADGTAPSPPSITAPTNGSTVTDTTPTWSWTPAGGTYRYALDGGTPIITTATTFTPGAALGNGSHTLTVAQRDPAGLWSGNASNTITIDGSAPYIVSRTTIDNDLDGQIDAIDVVLSEAMGTATGTWTVTGYAVGTPTWPTTTRLRIPLTEKTTPDTGALPAVLYSSGVADVAGNALPPEGAGTTPADGAAPVITGFSGTFGSTSATITFSEPVATSSNGTGNLVAGDFTYTPGTTSISGFSDANGLDQSVGITTSVAVASGNTIAAVAASIYDVAGNAAGTTSKAITEPTATKDTAQAGDWATPATWVGGTVPAASDDVVIKHAVTVTQPGATYPFYQVKTLTIDTGGSLNATGVVSSTTYYTLISVTDRVVESRIDTTVGNIQFYDNGTAQDFIFRVASGTTLTLLNTAQGHFVRSVVKQGAGTLAWQSVPNYYPNVANGSYDDGPLRVEAGTFRLVTAGGRDAGYALTVQGGATLDLLADYSTSSLSGQGLITRGATGTATLSVAAGSYSGVLANGTGSLALTTTGAVDLSGTNTATGGITVSSGTLRVLGGAAVANTCPLNLAGGSLQVDAAETVGAVQGAGGILLNGALTVAQGATSTTHSGPISGAAALTVTGSGGTLSLRGANTFTGGLTLGSGARVDVDANDRLGADAGALNLAGGTLALSGSVNMTSVAVTSDSSGNRPAFSLVAESANRPITISSGGFDLGANALALPAYDTAVGQTQTFSGLAGSALFVVVPTGATATWAGNLLAGSGTLGWVNKLDLGTWVLQGTNTWNKNILRVEQGTLRVGSASALGPVVNWIFTLGNGTFDLGAFDYSSSTIYHFLSGTMLAGGGTARWGGTIDVYPYPDVTPTNTPTFSVTSGSLVASGAVTGSRAWSKTGAGTLSITSATANSGLTAAGTVNGGTLAIARADQLGTNTLTLNGGTLRATANGTDARGLSVLAGGGTVEVDSGVTWTTGGIISGGGLLTKAGTGTLVLSGANTWTGDAQLSAGILSIDSDARLGGVGSDLIFAGGQLSTTATLTVGAARTVTLNSGGGTVSVTGGTTCTIAGLIGGTGTLAKTGTGGLALSGANTYTGATSVAAGELAISHATALGTSAAGTTVASGAALSVAGGITSTEPLTIDGSGGGSGVVRATGGSNTLSGTVVLSGSNPPTLLGAATSTGLTLSGVISGSGGLSKVGAGTVTLSGANLFTGTVTVGSGTLSIGSDGNLGSTGNALALAGGTLALSQSVSSTRSLSVATGTSTIDTGAGFTLELPAFATASGQDLALLGSGQLIVNGSTARSLSGLLSGSATLRKRGSHVLSLVGANTAFTGAIAVEAGQLSVEGISALGTTAGATTGESGATIRLAFAGASAEPITINGTLLGAANATLSAPLVLDGPSVVEASAGALVLAGGVSGGGSGGQTLNLRGASTAGNLVSGAIAATISSVTKEGTSTWSLSGANAFVGNLLVLDGTLRLAAAGTVPDSVDVTVNAGRLQLDMGTNQETVGRITGGSTAGVIDLTAGDLAVITDDSGLYPGTITGSGSLLKGGGGTWRLTGASTGFTGPLSIAGGTVRLQAGGRLPAATSYTVLSGATLALSDDDGVVADRLNNAAAILLSNGTLSLTADDAGSTASAETVGAISLTGSASRIVVTASAGNDAVLTASDLGAGQVTVERNNAAGGGLAFLRLVNYAGAAVGDGQALTTVTVSGTSAIYELAPTHYGVINSRRETVLDGAWTTATTWQGGILPGSSDTVYIRHDVTLGANASCDRLEFTVDGSSLSGTATLTVRGGTVSVGDLVTATVGCPLDGSTAADALVKAGPGTLVLDGTSLHTGTTTVQQGELRLDTAAGDAIQSSAGVRVQGGATLRLGAAQTLQDLDGFGAIELGSHALTVAVDTAYVWENDASNGTGAGNEDEPYFAGVIAGSGAVNKIGAGSWIVGGANTYTGTTTISGGTLLLASGTATLGAGTADAPAGLGTTVAGGALALANGAEIPTDEPLTLNNGAVWNLLRDNRVLAPITLSGTGRLYNVDAGAGNRGTLTIEGAIDLGANTLELGGDSPQPGLISGAITGSGGLTRMAQASPDTVWQLVAGTTHTYSGPTVLAAGVLVCDATLSASPMAVQSGATLAGSGSLAAVGVATGGTIAPGGGNAAILGMGSLALASGAVLDYGLGTANDRIDVGGALVLDGIVDVTEVGTFSSGTYTLLNAGSITDNTLAASLPSGSAGTIVATATAVLLTVDTIVPQITAITSTTADGTYFAGAAIDVTVQFSEAVNLTGGLDVTLDTGAVVTCTAVSGDPTRASGTYTVQIGDLTGDLDATAVALTSGGAFADLTGNAGTATLPGDTIADLRAIVIDNQAPEVSVANNGFGVANPSATSIATQGILSLGAVVPASAVRYLEARDTESARGILLYSMRIDPSQGAIEYDNTGTWEAVTVAGTRTTFTQADVDAGRVRYRHASLVAGSDAFAFDVSDGTKTSPLTIMRFNAIGNAAPAIAGLPASLTYTEEATHQVWQQVAASVSVTDDASFFPGGTLTCTVANATLTSGDALGFLPSASGISVDAFDVVRVGATVVGTFSRASDYSFTISFAATAGPLEVEALVTALGYRNTRVDPDPTLVRVVEIAITDGTGGQVPNSYSIPVAIATYNDPPIITVGAPIIGVPGIARILTVTVSDPEGDPSLVCTPATTPTRGVLLPVTATTFTYTPHYPGPLDVADILTDSFTITAVDTGFSSGASDPRRQGTATAATSVAAAYTVRISDGGGGAPRFDAPMRLTVAATLPFSYLPQVTTQPGASLTWELVAEPGQLATDRALPPGNPAKASFDPASGQLTWPSVPAPTDGSGYYRFSIMVTDTTSQTATVLPVMLRVGPGGAG